MAEIAGLKLIVPSSVAGSGVSLSGAKVVFAAAATVSVNGVFDSTYDNYLVVMRHSASSGTGIDMRLRSGGSDNSTASSYVTQYIVANNTSVSGARTTSDKWNDFSASYSTQRDGTHMYFYGPALAQPTAARSVVALGFSSAYIVDNAATHNQSTAYDGFTFFSDTTQTFTGALTVYGLSQ